MITSFAFCWHILSWLLVNEMGGWRQSLSGEICMRELYGVLDFHGTKIKCQPLGSTSSKKKTTINGDRSTLSINALSSTFETITRDSLCLMKNACEMLEKYL